MGERMSSTSRLALACAVAAAFASAAPLRAGELAVEGHGGYFQRAAKDSAQAVFETDGTPIFGGGARYTFWKGLFASAAMRTFSEEGERVFVASPGGPVQRLGFPLRVAITPILLQAGWRFRDGKLIVPYVSAGVAITQYEETSDVAGESFDNEFTKTGFTGAAGVEVGRGIFRFAGEVGYTTVPDAIGFGGVSAVYGEDDIGGLHVIGKIVIAFGL
jgi:opacity protein-like surface antigen